MPNHLCDYGCRKEAIHQFKNGKRCCSIKVSGCPIFSKIHSERMKGENNPMYGKKRNHTEEIKKKISKSIKGHKHPNYGKQRSKETREKIGEYHKGKTLSHEHKQIISNFHKGKKKSLIHRKNISEGRKGIQFSEKTKIKMSINHADVSGKNNPNWKGGVCHDSYCEQWRDSDYKESIKERDGYTCLNPVCNKNSHRLSIHHIDYNKKNCRPLNLITVCTSCNSIANFDRGWHKSWYQAIIERRYK